ncbi:hypothetical protein ELZ19_06880 [Brucella abortus]|uniref:hypothetical protein n=1 Tax=Brucella abortus TaxID=235 RepID=UPI0004E8AFD7|nr:hypothetical protein [Brucella abortus]KFH18468.1 hypothetical protein IB60_17370 [Brucella abortus LMN1]RUQ67296.1 hypothetical protein ELZ23_15310 [Brucella abortus]RUQ78572.1 hypothetical protein ELZ22_17015 [Brucella abortus]RUQ88314.1 hypothetical protein ELZ18_15770 [Brucella abortus]RUQ90345.1 hypothetical protein ELZ20_15775 [Brucella abortus]
MLYALIFACSLTSGQCILAEDEYGPYETVEACRERLVEMTPPAQRFMASRLAPPIQGQSTCGPLEELRKRWPDAFEDATPEVRA